MFGRLQLGAVRDHPRTTIELGVTDGFDALRHYERGRFRRAAQTPFLGATEGGRWRRDCRAILWSQGSRTGTAAFQPAETTDRKSTRLNSSHLVISYAVF